MKHARDTALILTQLAILALVCRTGYFLTDYLHLPLPGNLVGMVLLLILLATGVVRLTWIERAASVLLKHLAFFFIPIAVGVIGLGDILRSSGLLLLLVLAASAAVGIVAAGLSAQAAARAQERVEAGAPHRYVPADDIA